MLFGTKDHSVTKSAFLRSGIVFIHFEAVRKRMHCVNLECKLLICEMSKIAK